MVILSYINNQGHKTRLIDPEQSIIDLIVNTYPVCSMRCFDFKRCELIVFNSENFQWVEVHFEINPRLNDFSNQNNVKRFDPSESEQLAA